MQHKSDEKFRLFSTYDEVIVSRAAHDPACGQVKNCYDLTAFATFAGRTSASVVKSFCVAADCT